MLCAGIAMQVGIKGTLVVKTKSGATKEIAFSGAAPLLAADSKEKETPKHGSDLAQLRS